jgi:hypothetical protein
MDSRHSLTQGMRGAGMTGNKLSLISMRIAIKLVLYSE